MACRPTARSRCRRGARWGLRDQARHARGCGRIGCGRPAGRLRACSNREYVHVDECCRLYGPAPSNRRLLQGTRSWRATVYSPRRLGTVGRLIGRQFVDRAPPGQCELVGRGSDRVPDSNWKFSERKRIIASRVARREQRCRCAHTSRRRAGSYGRQESDHAAIRRSS